ncbi:Pentatricopeptide repeat superfamily protein isoform 1 [Hibiscus syriacus]|uniref:Pentatricopeptide repeat superfamily protein isoform 1 n=1 Tax=Hibiscus syriacus TaxID=106335 RepID=A0A6A2XLK6_HIBSY|nr:pectinesterase inhibitor 5-like [Hibiscus syriacus]KAE8676673.1 Pentatricopeptide repeat superfamily protein isoform 1 [Hibiscus syriacus]
MGTMKCSPSMAATILLLTVCSSFNGGGADQALIESICKQSQDYAFCMNTLGSDPRSDTADLRGLAMISSSLSIIQIQDTLRRLPDIIKQSTDRLTIQRLEVCQSDYDGSLANFQSASNATSNNAFYDTIDFVRNGTNRVIDCHNIFRKDGPIAISPIAGDDINVFKLGELVLIAIDGLIHKKQL